MQNQATEEGQLRMFFVYSKCGQQRTIKRTKNNKK
jgi:hypothetical protein